MRSFAALRTTGASCRSGTFDGESRLVDLEHAVLVQQLAVETVLLERIERAHDGGGQRLVGEGEAGGLREHARDGAGEVAALLHEPGRGVDAGRLVRLAAFMRPKDLRGMGEGHSRNSYQ